MRNVVMWGNAALAFLLELAMLAAFGFWAVHSTPGGWLSWLAAVAIVAAAILIWAVWAAPRSKTRLPPLPLLAVKTLMFGSAAIGLAATGQAQLGIALAAIAAVNLGLSARLNRV